jgi:hypothetical protein
VRDGRTHCFSHDPSKREARSRVAASGGRGKGVKEVRTLKAEVRELISDVRSGAVDRADAATMISGYRALRDFIELERRVKESDELEARIAELERAADEINATNGARDWRT